MSAFCGMCKTDLSPEKEIACDLCHSYIHTTCAGLSRTEVLCLKSKERKLTFYCTECSDFKAQLKNLQALKSLVDDLKAEVDILKGRGSPGLNVSMVETEVIIREMSEREKRKNNIILFNIPEEMNGHKNDQIAADKSTAQKIASVLDIPLMDPNPIRLGKFDMSKSNRKRPIKLMLANSEYVIKALRNSKKLKLVQEFASVGVSRDRTPYQQQLWRNARQELVRRREAGETDIIIKYIKDVPTIVKAKTSLN